VNPVGELLDVSDIHLDVDLSSKAELLEKLAGWLAGRHGLSKREVLNSLNAREQLGSTGLGHGVAIPHARMSECGAATGIFVRTRAAVPFNAPDGKPVSLFLALVVPKHATHRHLQLLAAAAGILSDRTIRDVLETSADPEAVRDLLAGWRDSATLDAQDSPAD
jgi:PTS system nitrogen regulatory IIA component